METLSEFIRSSVDSETYLEGRSANHVTKTLNKEPCIN
jgi:hypothetical protein